MQTKKMSLIETVSSVIIGFIVAIVVRSMITVRLY